MNKPIKMRFWIGGYGSTEYELTYDGIHLHYRSFHLFDPSVESVDEFITVNQDDWDTFRKELDVIGAWDWKPTYDSGAEDGTQWEFKIDWQHRLLNIYGSNCYPESEGSPSDSCEYTRTFRRFLNALGQLAGGKRIE